MKKTIVTKNGIEKRNLNQTEITQSQLDEQENIRLKDLQYKEQRKKELIEIMTEANALRDNSKWQEAKLEYDSL